MEAELLRDMIADRDKRIEKSKRKTAEQRTKELVLCEQLEKVAGQVAEQKITMGAEREALQHAQTQTLGRLRQMHRDFRQQGASLQTYCKDPVPAAAQTDASYVMRMQAQLCKAMHSLGITDHQMDLVQQHSDSIIKYQKEQVAFCTEARTTTELLLMNELIAKDNERREAEAVFTRELNKIFKEREALERQMEENRGDSDDEDNEEDDPEAEEEDEEEKENKEELMKLLTERRAEIEHLEQLQEEQQELIADLEDQLREMEAEGGGGGGGEPPARNNTPLAESPAAENEEPEMEQRNDATAAAAAAEPKAQSKGLEAAPVGKQSAEEEEESDPEDDNDASAVVVDDGENEAFENADQEEPIAPHKESVSDEPLEPQKETASDEVAETPEARDKSEVTDAIVDGDDKDTEKSPEDTKLEPQKDSAADEVAEIPEAIEKIGSD
jgi:hypothetical protein